MLWPTPAMGVLGPPAEPQQGALGAAATQSSSRQGFCLWCKALDHVIGQCPLNAYASEQFPPAPKQKAAGKQGTQL